MNEKMNRNEAAEYVGLSSETLRRMEKEGRGPSLYRFSERLVKYSKEDLDDWLRSKRIDHSNADE